VNCPLCGHSVTYEGLNNLECTGSAIKRALRTGNWGQEACPNYKDQPGTAVDTGGDLLASPGAVLFMLCRFCQQEGVHHCRGGELKEGDRYYDLYGDTRAFPGLADASDHPLNTLTVPEPCASITESAEFLPRKESEEKTWVCSQIPT
jgi:hypothetical protein